MTRYLSILLLAAGLSGCASGEEYVRSYVQSLPARAAASQDPVGYMQITQSHEICLRRGPVASDAPI